MKYFYKRVVIFLCLISTPLILAAQQDQNYYGSHRMWSGWYGMFFNPIFMIIITALVILSVICLVRWVDGGSDEAGSKSPEEQDPLDILKKRFASGDIDKDEFIERRQLLQEK